MPEPPLHRALGSPFIELQSVDSTNNYALSMVHAGLAQMGTAIFAHRQTAGKGQRGKTWLSDQGKSLSVSVVMDPAPLPVMHQFHLSACMAVTVCDFLNRYTADGMRIKWPNDLYWQDRKAGGILIESVIGAGALPGGDETVTQWKWAVVGVGININQPGFPAELDNPVSLTQITGRHFIPGALARELREAMIVNFRDLVTRGFTVYLDRFNALLYRKEERVRFKNGPIVFEGIVKGVSDTGQLLVDHGTVEAFGVGELQWLNDPSAKQPPAMQ